MNDLTAYETMHEADYSKLYSIDSEQNIIGIALQAPEKLLECELINPIDVYREDHKIVISACLDMLSNGKQIDIALLCDYLQNIGELENIGGIEYLVDIARNTPSLNTLNAHIEIVKQKAHERRIIAAAQGMKDSIMFDNGSHTDRVSKAEQIVTEALQVDEKHETVFEMKDVLKAYIEDLDYRFNNDEQQGLLTGLKNLDERWSGLLGGNMVLIGARPSMGKTTALTAMLDGISRAGKKTYFSSLEMSQKQITQRLMASIGSIDLPKLINAKLTGEDWPKLTAATSIMKNWKVKFDDQGGVDIADLRSRWRAEKRKNDLDCIMVDYLQLIDDRTQKNRFDVVSSVSRKLKAVAKELDVVLIVLSQLSRAVEQRNDKRPSNSDLRESGQLEQDADIICFLYRDEVYDKGTTQKGIIEFITTKFRDGEIGTDYFNFVGIKNQIKDLTYDYSPPEPEQKQYKQKGF